MEFREISGKKFLHRQNGDANGSSHHGNFRFDIFRLTLVNLFSFSASLRHLNLAGSQAGPERVSSVAYIVYRDHTIVSSAVYDDVSGNWRLNACVSWQEKGDQIQFLKDSLQTFARFEEAEVAGIEYSKSWIDNKLTSSDLP
jgi:hypothetical protein